MELMRNEKGVALVVVLLLAVVGLIVTAGLLHMLARGGYMSGQHKRYGTAMEAARGGLEATVQVVADRGSDTMGLDNVVPGVNLVSKLTNATGAWASTVDNTSIINPSDSDTYDLRFDVGEYRIHSKIIDTVVGNSAEDTGLLKSGVVNTGSGEVTVMNVPFLYTIEELAQSRVTPSERATISVLYQY